VIGLRGFLAGLVLVALVAAILSAPKVVKLGSMPELRAGSPGDTGPQGHSLLARLLEDRGYQVSYDVEPPLDWQGSVVYFIAGPTDCNAEVVREVAENAKALAAIGLRVGIIVADEGACAQHLLGMLGAPTIGLSPGSQNEPWLALYQDRGVIFAMYTASIITYIASAPNGGEWRQTAVTLYPRGFPAILEWNSSLGVVYIPDSHVFNNMVLGAANETGLGNAELAVTLVEKLGGNNAIVLMPLGFYQLVNPSIPLLAYIHPGMLILRAVERLSGFETMVIESMMMNPLAATVLVIGVMAMLYMAFAWMTGKDWAEERPPQQPELPRLLGASLALEKLQRGVKLTRKEARQALATLYEVVDEALRLRLGAGLREVLENPEFLESVTRGAGIDYERVLEGLRELYRLYDVKIRARQLFPPVFSWRRRLYYVLERVEPLLETMGVGLTEVRGIEYSFTR